LAASSLLLCSVSAEVVVAEEAVVVVMVSTPHAGIRFKTRDLCYYTSPEEDVVFVRMTPSPSNSSQSKAWKLLGHVVWCRVFVRSRASSTVVRYLLVSHITSLTAKQRWAT
jgi:hypothetical protein